MNRVATKRKNNTSMVDISVKMPLTYTELVCCAMQILAVKEKLTLTHFKETLSSKLFWSGVYGLEWPDFEDCIPDDEEYINTVSKAETFIKKYFTGFQEADFAEVSKITRAVGKK